MQHTLGARCALAPIFDVARDDHIDIDIRRVLDVLDQVITSLTRHTRWHTTQTHATHQAPPATTPQHSYCTQPEKANEHTKIPTAHDKSTVARITPERSFYMTVHPAREEIWLLSSGHAGASTHLGGCAEPLRLRRPRLGIRGLPADLWDRSWPVAT